MAGNSRSGRKANEQVFRHALLDKLDALDPSKDRKKLHRIADKLIDLALGGDMQAIKEVMDRVDGKPKQVSEVTGPEGGAIAVTHVEYAIFDPKDEG